MLNMCQVTQSNGLKTNDLAKKTLQGLNWFSLEETILDNSLQGRLKIEVMAIFALYVSKISCLRLAEGSPWGLWDVPPTYQHSTVIMSWSLINDH